ncbi:hypothetical protein HD596_002138 [Nonomuraea jabiensis]|uniref:Uncharacterized protein n=1 Tax=Nonomuraea jabiensis TaxID=882448 RepID=A0A7W9G183_9ACTN|nr:hypothetical protein [Nonomuraea jabiensis]
MSTPCGSCPPGLGCGSPTCTVAKLIHDYPSLHVNRTQTLHRLLCHTGNGFEWHGEHYCEYEVTIAGFRRPRPRDRNAGCAES